MTEWQKFRISFDRHPGLESTLIVTVIYVVIGIATSSHWLEGVGVGAGASLMFWIPLLVTAWSWRHEYGDE